MGVLQIQTEQKKFSHANMMKELVALSLCVFLLSTVESQKPIKKVLSIVKDIKKNMLTLDEMEVMKGQIVDEVVDSIVPVIKESCSCCDDEPPQDCEGNQGVFAAGGRDDNGSGSSPPLFYNPFTNMECELPHMNQPRYSSTTTAYISCGGSDYNATNNFPIPAAYNCERFDPCTGNWSNPNHIEWMTEGYPPRIRHVAWMSSIGLFLIGGLGETDSSMLINKIGQLSPGLINSGKYGACAVSDPRNDQVIIIGGYDGSGASSDTVDVFDIDGYVSSLPSLNSPRYWAGCSGYYNDAGNLVLIVTGGNSGETETLEVGVDPEWYTEPCYNPWDISCADANNEVYCLQGYNSYEIEEFDKINGCFEVKAYTQDSRGYFGNFASSVCLDNCNPEDYCVNYEIVKKAKATDHSKPIPGQNEEDRITIFTAK